MSTADGLRAAIEALKKQQVAVNGLSSKMVSLFGSYGLGECRTVGGIANVFEADSSDGTVMVTAAVRYMHQSTTPTN